MTCIECQALLDRSERGGSFTDAEAAAAVKHTDHCEGCKALARQLMEAHNRRLTPAQICAADLWATLRLVRIKMDRESGL